MTRRVAVLIALTVASACAQITAVPGGNGSSSPGQQGIQGALGTTTASAVTTKTLAEADRYNTWVFTGTSAPTLTLFTPPDSSYQTKVCNGTTLDGTITPAGHAYQLASTGGTSTASLTLKTTTSLPNCYVFTTNGTTWFINQTQGPAGAAGPSSLTVRAITGTTDTVLAGDTGKLLTYSNTAAIAVTLPQATGSFTAPFYFKATNNNIGVVTVTPTTSTINGAATLLLYNGQSVDIVSDGTNWQAAGALKPLAIFSMPGGSAAMTTSALYAWQVGFSTEVTRTGIISSAGVLKNLHMVSSAIPTTNSSTCTVRTAAPGGTNADTALAATVTSAGAIGDSVDSTHSVAVVAGSQVTIKCVQNTSGTGAVIVGLAVELW